MFSPHIVSLLQLCHISAPPALSNPDAMQFLDIINIDDVLVLLLSQSGTHGPCWNPRDHYGSCGQSCPCCRWIAGESFGDCEACQEMKEISDSHEAVRSVSKLWRDAVKEFQEHQAFTMPRGLTDMPWRATIRILAHAVGHVATPTNMWYSSLHDINGTCGPLCNCCVATNSDQPGCWECKTYVMVKRLSVKFRLMAKYRAIQST